MKVEERLQKILGSVNEWLRFAEAKNAAAFSANIAILAAVIKLWPTSGEWWYVSLGVSTVSCSISAVIVALVSFAPQLTLPFWTRRALDDKKRNLLFFGDIAQFAPRDYVVALRERYGVDSNSPDTLVHDYCEQIVINSRIAGRKFSLFNLALYLTLAAIATPVISLLVGMHVASRNKAAG